MEKTKAREMIRGTLTQKFDKQRFYRLIKEILNANTNESKAQVWSNTIVKDAFKSSVQYYERLGTYADPNDEQLDILIVYLKKDSSLERARTFLRNFVADYLETRGHKDAALVAFVSPDESDWRFSYVKMEYAIGKDKLGKMKVQEKLTPAKRYSFLVGSNENSYTAQNQLLPLLESEDPPKLASIELAFSIETVTKEFFREYSRLFETTEAALAELVKQDKVLRTDFETKNVSTVNFTKKLLGQIVFLYFIQKKGWLGVPKGENWGKGPRDFLRHLSNRAIKNNRCLFNDILEPLFYDTLATDRGHEAWCKIFQCRIPFLNGGLFEPLAGYDWENTEISLPNTIFTNFESSPQGDIGTGILDVFDRYNFTVNEAEPLEKEVAIDPEMLGKVFENLIEENRRKGLGAFYTPREIVHYMCQESLINYLDAGLNRPQKPIGVATPIPENQHLLYNDSNEPSKPKLGQQEIMEAGNRVLVLREDLEIWINQSDQFAHYATAIAAGTKGGHYPKPPESIRKYAREIDDLLRDITVCDPAIGSGAFPVGMMTEIIRARTALTPYFNDLAERTAYHFKRHAIQNSLYGVDIDVGAVEIAKLRLWLSLVVDEENVQQIKPLPNLDYKIVVGNSLMGVEKNLFNHEQFNRLEELKPKFFNESDRRKKAQFKKQIELLIHDLTNGRESFDFEIYFSEVFQTKRGFDVVVANPPYGLVGNDQAEAKEYYTSGRFELTSYKTNLYLLFLERALELLNSYTGVLSFIIPKSLVFNSYFESARRKLLERYSIPLIVEIRAKVFEAAEVGDSVLFFACGSRPTSRSALEYRVVENVASDSKIISMQTNLQADLTSSIGVRFLASSINITQTIKLDDLWEVSNGLNPGNVRHILLSTSKLTPKHRKMLLGRDVKKYVHTWSGTWVNFDPSLKDTIKSTETKSKKGMTAQKRVDFALRPTKIYMPNKVMVRKTADHIIACLDFEGLCFDSLSYGIQPRLPGYDPKFLLGLLNSKLLGHIHSELSQNQGKVFAKVLAENIRKLPMPNLKIEIPEDRAKHDAVVALTESILKAKNGNVDTDTSVLERKMDSLVYELYGLTKDEIKIVEGSSACE